MRSRDGNTGTLPTLFLTVLHVHYTLPGVSLLANMIVPVLERVELEELYVLGGVHVEGGEACYTDRALSRGTSKARQHMYYSTVDKSGGRAVRDEIKFLVRAVEI